MRLLRTAGGGFINAEKIVCLVDERGATAGGGWIALLGDGEEVALSSYYSTPGRVERDLPDLAPATRRPAPALMPADCSGVCCYEL